LQYEMDKMQISIDCQQVYKEALQSFTAEKLKSLNKLQQNSKDAPADYERALKTELKKAGEKNIRRVQGNRVQVSTGFNDGSFYFVIDTLITTEAATGRERSRPVTAFVKTTVPSENRNMVVESKVLLPATRVYLSTNGNSVTPDEKGIKKYYEKVSTVVEPNDKPATVSQPKPGAIYHRNSNSNAETAPAKIYMPKEVPPTPSKGVRVEYKTGVIVVNGRKLELPETYEIFALHSVKGKKLLSKAKDLVETRIDD
ncbi:MAG TPA: hypothetical protein VMY77_07735, partial [Chitinophagaceae bacterium]|nr:hypothetical protein [Chitinophagaceae bacterium]